MNQFAKRFRDIRIANRATLRQIAASVGKTIGYLSDIEHGRRNPPDDETVGKIEKALGVKGDELRNIARQMRELPADFTSRIKISPMMADWAKVLMRAEENLTHQELQKIFEKTQKLIDKGSGKRE